VYDSSLYPAEVIQKAAYKSLNKMTLNLKVVGSNLVCELQSNKNISDEAFELAVEEFKKDVLDYLLRDKIKKESEPLRNLILSIAFSKTGL
jgi:His-Xaa-Ser system protein HxsD